MHSFMVYFIFPWFICIESLTSAVNFAYVIDVKGLQEKSCYA